MNINELFIDGNELPKPLSRHEVYELLEKIKQGDELAREKLVVHNIRLVLYEVTSRFESVEYDKKDLVSIGNIGLLKAITTFDTSKRVEFSTYAARCIDNEILMFLKKLKKERKIDSLDRTINYDKDGNELKVEDIIGDGTDIVEEYTDNETYQIIRQIVNDLPYRDRKIIMLHFGFFNNKTYTQNEIADLMSISQTYVSLLIKKIVKKVGKQLQQKGVIELRTEVKNKAKTRKKSRKLQTIYEHFSSYTKDQVDAILEILTEEEKALIKLRYGEDLNNPIAGNLTKEQIDKFYRSLIPKMKRLLCYTKKEEKTKIKMAVEKQPPMKNLILEIPKLESNILDGETITAEDYNKLLELLKAPNFTKMIGVYSLKETMIVLLKLGYIDGKSFSNSSIAEFLGIEPWEVIETARTVLLTYKERISPIMVENIPNVTESQKNASSVIKTLKQR